MDYYEITINNHAEHRRIRSFDGMKIEQLPNSRTVISGFVKDQAQLHAILNKIRDMGIQLLYVKHMSQVMDGTGEIRPDKSGKEIEGNE